MTDVTHIIHNPDLAAIRAEIQRAQASLDRANESLDLLVLQAPYKAQSTATDAAWQPIGSVASRVVDRISKREAAE